MVYPRDSQSYLVKIGIRTSLEREFRGLSIAHAAMPRNVPRPLGLTTQGTFQVLVTQGVEHEQLILRRGRDSCRVFERGMEAFLATSLSHFKASPTDAAMNVRDALREASDVSGWARLAGILGSHRSDDGAAAADTPAR